MISLLKNAPLLLFLYLLSFNATGQDAFSFSQAQRVFGSQKILSFRKFSLELKDHSKGDLKEISSLIKAYPALLKNNVLILQIFSCEAELKVKPYIGVVRAHNIISQLQKELGLSRKKCYIRDDGASGYDRDCKVGSGINLYLKPEL